jgi:hypothetical protein
LKNEVSQQRISLSVVKADNERHQIKTKKFEKDNFELIAEIKELL